MIERPIMNATTALVWCTGTAVSPPGLEDGVNVGTTLVVDSSIVDDMQGRRLPPAA